MLQHVPIAWENAHPVLDIVDVDGGPDPLWKCFFGGLTAYAGLLACDKLGLSPENLFYRSRGAFEIATQQRANLSMEGRRPGLDEESQGGIRFIVHERRRQAQFVQLFSVRRALIETGTVGALWQQRQRLMTGKECEPLQAPPLPDPIIPTSPNSKQRNRANTTSAVVVVASPIQPLASSVTSSAKQTPSSPTTNTTANSEKENVVEDKKTTTTTTTQQEKEENKNNNTQKEDQQQKENSLVSSSSASAALSPSPSTSMIIATTPTAKPNKKIEHPKWPSVPDPAAMFRWRTKEVLDKEERMLSETMQKLVTFGTSFLRTEQSRLHEQLSEVQTKRELQQKELEERKKKQQQISDNNTSGRSASSIISASPSKHSSPKRETLNTNIASYNNLSLARAKKYQQKLKHRSMASPFYSSGSGTNGMRSSLEEEFDTDSDKEEAENDLLLLSGVSPATTRRTRELLFQPNQKNQNLNNISGSTSGTNNKTSSQTQGKNNINNNRPSTSSSSSKSSCSNLWLLGESPFSIAGTRPPRPPQEQQPLVTVYGKVIDDDYVSTTVQRHLKVIAKKASQEIATVVELNAKDDEIREEMQEFKEQRYALKKPAGPHFGPGLEEGLVREDRQRELKENVEFEEEELSDLRFEKMNDRHERASAKKDILEERKLETRALSREAELVRRENIRFNRMRKQQVEESRRLVILASRDGRQERVDLLHQQHKAAAWNSKVNHDMEAMVRRQITGKVKAMQLTRQWQLDDLPQDVEIADLFHSDKVMLEWNNGMRDGIQCKTGDMNGPSNTNNIPFFDKSSRASELRKKRLFEEQQEKQQQLEKEKLGKLEQRKSSTSSSKLTGSSSQDSYQDDSRNSSRNNSRDFFSNEMPQNNHNNNSGGEFASSGRTTTTTTKKTNNNSSYNELPPILPTQNNNNDGDLPTNDANVSNSNNDNNNNTDVFIQLSKYSNNNQKRNSVSENENFPQILHNKQQQQQQRRGSNTSSTNSNTNIVPRPPMKARG